MEKQPKKNIKLSEIKLTLTEWFDALKTPAPHRNKKKYYRKNKHKNKDSE
jgi:hypothetical protein|tara:strand:+ start:275 stop:424 length:150 start_codon:yes stop_codon:yes gene_type:complete